MEDIQEIEDLEPKPVAKVGSSRSIKGREIDQKAEELKKLRALPPKPADRVDFDSLITWSKLLTPVMWEHIMIYVYRWLPVIRREPKYIDVISSPDNLSLDSMIKTHGGGKYGLYVTDTDKKENATVFEARVEIPMSKYDPILSYDELDRTCRENRSYIENLKARRILDIDGNVIEKEKPMAPGQDATAMVGVVREVASIIKSLNSDQQDRIKKQLDPEGGLGKSIGDILLEKMKQDDPTKQMNMFTSLITAMKGMMPEAPKQDGGLKDIITIIMPLFTQLMATQSENSKMMIEAIRESKNSNKDPLDSIDKVLDVTAKIQEASGGGNIKRGTMEVLVDAAKDILPSIFSNVRDMMVLSKLGPQGVAALNKNPQPQPATEPTEEGAPQVQANELVQNLQMAMPILLDHIINKETDGASFADMLVGMYGLPAHIAIAKFGEDKILETIKAIPNLYQPIVSKFGEEYLKTWVYEFVHFKEVLAEEEANAGQEEAEVNNTTKKKKKAN